MQLLDSVLRHLKNTKKPQQQFVGHVLRVLLLLPGHATLRNLSRSSAYHERTFARGYARDVDFVSLNKAAMSHVLPPSHEQALVIDASFVPKSGKKTSGLDRCWNGSHSRAEKGLEISALAWLDITDNCAYGLRVEQTPATGEATDPEATRLDVYLDQVTRVVSAQHLHYLRYVITDGYDGSVIQVMLCSRTRGIVSQTPTEIREAAERYGRERGVSNMWFSAIGQTDTANHCLPHR